MPDIDYWLARKYAQLQEHADAASQNAASQAIAATSSAALDTTRAGLLPAESQAGIAKTRADTNFLNQQAQYLGPETLARIRNLGAEANLTNTQAQVAGYRGLPTQGPFASSPGLFKAPDYTLPTLNPPSILDDFRERNSGFRAYNAPGY